MDVIFCPCYDLSRTMLVKGVSGNMAGIVRSELTCVVFRQTGVLNSYLGDGVTGRICKGLSRCHNYHLAAFQNDLSVDFLYIIMIWINVKQIGISLYSDTEYSFKRAVGISILTHWGRDKMAAIFQTTVSNGFSWMKMYEFRLKFHWSLSHGLINNIPALV